MLFSLFFAVKNIFCQNANGFLANKCYLRVRLRTRSLAE